MRAAFRIKIYFDSLFQKAKKQVALEMKNLILALVFLGLAAYVGQLVYERVSEHEWSDDGEKTEALIYPFEMELESADGRCIDVTILGRNDEFVQFKRKVDGGTFAYPIAGLSAGSRKKVVAYPVTGLTEAQSLLRQGQLTLSQAHIEQLKERIHEIEAELEDLQRRHDISSSKVERRTMQREAEALMRERDALGREIAEKQL